MLAEACSVASSTKHKNKRDSVIVGVICSCDRLTARGWKRRTKLKGTGAQPRVLRLFTAIRTRRDSIDVKE